MAVNAVVLTTGPLLTLAEAKQHLNVDSEDQDTLVQSYVDAAVLAVLNEVDRPLVPQGAEPVFKAAALLMLGDLYANREAVIIGTIVAVNPTVGNLLRPYRIIRV